MTKENIIKYAGCIERLSLHDAGLQSRVIKAVEKMTDAELANVATVGDIIAIGNTAQE